MQAILSSRWFVETSVSIVTVTVWSFAISMWNVAAFMYDVPTSVQVVVGAMWAVSGVI